MAKQSLDAHWAPGLLYVGVQDMVRGGMGKNIGGYFSRAHAGVDPHEVHLHQPIWVSLLMNSQIIYLFV